jgi:hypothetical protein
MGRNDLKPLKPMISEACIFVKPFTTTTIQSLVFNEIIHLAPFFIEEINKMIKDLGMINTRKDARQG